MKKKTEKWKSFFLPLVIVVALVGGFYLKGQQLKKERLLLVKPPSELKFKAVEKEKSLVVLGEEKKLIKLAKREIDIVEIRFNWEKKVEKYFIEKNESKLFNQYLIARKQDLKDLTHLFATNSLNDESAMEVHLKNQKILESYLGESIYRGYVNLLIKENQELMRKGVREKLFF
jgi:hypothetical protein